jgi:hypothetical protein
MKQEFSKFRSQEKEKLEQAQHTEPKTEARDFSSVEEMLRFDANQTSPPTTISDRLKESLNQEPQPKKSWWRRLFS